MTGGAACQGLRRRGGSSCPGCWWQVGWGRCRLVQRLGQQGEQEAVVDALLQHSIIVDRFARCVGDVEETDGERPELLLLAVGKLLLGLQVALEGHQAVLVALDGEREAAQLLLEGAQRSVEIIDFRAHRGELIELLKLLKN